MAGSGEKVLTGVGTGSRKDRGGRREVFESSGEGRVTTRKKAVA